MIQFDFFRSASDGSIHMHVCGHAGAAPKGEDLVCASASTLAYTAAQAVQFLYERKLLRRRPKIVLRDGEAVIIATPRRDTEAETLMTFWTVQAGAWVLSRSYPDFVRLHPMGKGAAVCA